jgi:hypothetical protein
MCQAFDVIGYKVLAWELNCIVLPERQSEADARVARWCDLLSWSVPARVRIPVWVERGCCIGDFSQRESSGCVNSGVRSVDMFRDFFGQSHLYLACGELSNTGLAWYARAAGGVKKKRQSECRRVLSHLQGSAVQFAERTGRVPPPTGLGRSKLYSRALFRSQILP